LYQQAASVQFLSKSQHVIEGGKTQEHVIFKVELEDSTEQKESKSIRTFQAFKPAVRDGFQISADQFCNAFPYHIIFNEHLEINQYVLLIQLLHIYQPRHMIDQINVSSKLVNMYHVSFE
jgi:hypothetical protein